MFLSPDTGARTRGDVLITGATGFLGMELMARLLEGGDRRVWALVRAPSQKAASERLRATLTSLMGDAEPYADRVEAVAGDLLSPGLGVSPRRRDELAEQVDEVIHAAASVSFTLPLAEAREINVAGTQRVLELATWIQRRGGLRRFAHVSTAYVAGTHRGDFAEHDLERGQGFNNTYERSKWEAEVVVQAHRSRLPVQVFRPSIVVGDELAEQVDEVIHAAASVSFSLPLAEAREINVAGTQRVLELASWIQRRGGLRRFAHVSTAYVAGTHRGDFSEHDLERGQGFNNTYERSKWEAEVVVQAHRSRLPVQVFRPSIVVGDERSGWTPSFNVIYTPLRAYASGTLPVVPARRSAPVDVVPVSYVARAILALADAGAGKTFNLAAGPAAGTVGELIDRAAAHLERPPARVLPPPLYKSVVHPLLLRRANPAQRRWLERGEVFFPYFASRLRFDVSAARAGLEPIDIRVPRVDAYLDRLLEFAVRANWGRRPVGRAEAGAGVRAVVASAA